MYKIKLLIKYNFKSLLILLVGLFVITDFTACNNQKKTGISIAVFIPGNIAGSPSYKMLADGVKKSVSLYNQNKTDNEKTQVTVLEAGTNQAEWETKMTALAAQGQYDVIITTNPSMPDIIKPLVKQFPKQKYIILDAFCDNCKNITTIKYNQREQSYLSGYIAALMSKTHKIGLIAAQEYPVMNNIILPGYKEGAEAAVQGTSVDFRVVGNWYDATKGADLSSAMAATGVDVILPICGGASQGVISAAKDKNFYISWFDDNGFAKAPGYIISSSVVEQEKAAEELTTSFLNKTIKWGTSRTVGIKDGYIKFVQDDPEYLKIIPETVQKKVKTVVNAIKTGKLILDTK